MWEKPVVTNYIRKRKSLQYLTDCQSSFYFFHWLPKLLTSKLFLCNLCLPVFFVFYNLLVGVCMRKGWMMDESMNKWDGRVGKERVISSSPYTETVAYSILHLDLFPVPISHEVVIIEIQVYPVRQILPRGKQISVFTCLSDSCLTVFI